MEPFTNKTNISINQMVLKLEQMRKEQDEIIVKAKELQNRYEQLDEDIDLLETMAMYKSNKDARKTEQRKTFNFR